MSYKSHFIKSLNQSRPYGFQAEKKPIPFEHYVSYSQLVEELDYWGNVRYVMADFV